MIYFVSFSIFLLFITVVLADPDNIDHIDENNKCNQQELGSIVIFSTKVASYSIRRIIAFVNNTDYKYTIGANIAILRFGIYHAKTESSEKINTLILCINK